MYTLSGWANEVTGWGVRDETWSAKEMLARYGAPTWFGLGDRDLATHLVRTQGLLAGERLTEVTARLATALGCPARLLPMTDDTVRTELKVDGRWLEFQEYFVHQHHAVDVTAVRHAGVEGASPTPEVLAAIADAELIVFAPSNPFVSIGTILAVPGIARGHRRRAGTGRRGEPDRGRRGAPRPGGPDAPDDRWRRGERGGRRGPLPRAPPGPRGRVRDRRARRCPGGRDPRRRSGDARAAGHRDELRTPSAKSWATAILARFLPA